MTTPSAYSARSSSGSRFSASSTVHSTHPSTSTHRRTPGTSASHGTRAGLAQLDQSVDASVERRPAEAVEPPVERDDLGDAQAPEERRAAARHVEPAP